MEPYALHLLRRFRAGESVGQLVSTEGIAPERILIRLRAARRYERVHKHEFHIHDQDTCPATAA